MFCLVRFVLGLPLACENPSNFEIYNPGSARGDSGIPVYPEKFAKNPQNAHDSSQYTQN